MFIQLFGNFLVEKAVITEEQKVSFQKELQDTRVKMGTIAVADGLINEAQAEEINHAQTQQDRRFGDIAIEMGYLTDAQISDIIKKQGDSAMKFYQLLTDKAGIAMNDIEANLEEFKKAQGFTDEELDALKRDDIDEHNRILSEEAGKYMESDVVVLAQASMAPAKESVERVKDWVVLTSPESCIEEVKAFYGKN